MEICPEPSLPLKLYLIKEYLSFDYSHFETLPFYSHLEPLEGLKLQMNKMCWKKIISEEETLLKSRTNENWDVRTFALVLTDQEFDFNPSVTMVTPGSQALLTP